MLNNRLKVFRAEHDLSQQQLADRIGVHRQTIVAMEQNKYQPSVGLALKLAQLFQTTVEEIFNLEGENEKKSV